jgi:hypothetical protein
LEDYRLRDIFDNGGKVRADVIGYRYFCVSVFTFGISERDEFTFGIFGHVFAFGGNGFCHGGKLLLRFGCLRLFMICSLLQLLV